MLKNISNLGKALNTTEKKLINGGLLPPLECDTFVPVYSGLDPIGWRACDSHRDSNCCSENN